MKRIILTTCFCCAIQAVACTDFRLIAQDKTVLVTRTLEFASPMNSQVRTSLVGRLFQEKAPNGRPGVNWKAQYGYLYMDAFDTDVVVDGMNEAGLSFEYLYLPGLTQYSTVPAGEEGRGLSYLHFGDWVLSNFDSVEAVRAALPQIIVFEDKLPKWRGTVFPLHAAIQDKMGNGIVVEFINGKMQISEYKGVMTNSPDYQWQLTNLQNYVHLSPVNPAPVIDHGMTYTATGQGAGMLGLPGDVTPPSRFVKMNALLATVETPKNDAQALNMAMHMVHTVDIPRGFVRESAKSTAGDYTQWTVFKDLTHGILYYYTYEDPALHAISMKKLDFSAQASRVAMPIIDPQQVIDMSGSLRQHVTR